MKIILKRLLPFIFLSLFLACKDRQKLKAKIFERKEIQDDKLMIKYKYVANGQSYIDSATIENKVIGSDTINVTINPSEPEKGSPQLQK